jgi:rhodanese-related sulfurtransferase
MAGMSIRDMIKAGARIIDVRTPGEFVDEAYPRAMNVPLAVLPARLGDLGPGAPRPPASSSWPASPMW